MICEHIHKIFHGGLCDCPLSTRKGTIRMEQGRAGESTCRHEDGKGRKREGEGNVAGYMKPRTAIGSSWSGCRQLGLYANPCYFR
jgi:hypothetical protein